MVKMIRAAGCSSPIRGASFIFQTRAGVVRAGREHRRERRRYLSLRLSASEADTTEGDHWGNDSGFGSTGRGSVEGEGWNGVIVGAKGAFPVERCFLSRRGGSGLCVGEDDCIEGRVEDPLEGASAGKRERVRRGFPSVEEGASKWWRSVGRVDHGGRSERGNISARLWRERRGQGSKVEDDKAMDLGSWLADFGMIVSAGGIDGSHKVDFAGIGADGGNSLVEWDWVNQQEGFVGERRYCEDALDCGQGVVRADHTVAKEGSRVEPRNTSGREITREAPRGPCKRAGDISNAGLGWIPIEETTTLYKGIEAEGETMVSRSTMGSPVIETAMKRGRGGNGGFDDGGNSRVPVRGTNEALDPVGFFDGLRRLASGRRDREARELELIVRAAGGELYELSDRLSALSASVANDPYIVSERSGVNVAVVARELESLRKALKTAGGREGRRLKWPADIRRAVRDAGRGVREAERAVREDTKLLADARARRATARSDLSACRAELDAARDRLHAGIVADAATSATLAALLRDESSSLDECADRLLGNVRVPDQRKACGGEMVAADDDNDDERLVASCKAKVAAFAGKVRQVCAEQRRRGQPPKRVGSDRRQGERLMTQAKALRRAISGAEGTGIISAGEAQRCGDEQVRVAIESFDIALVEADCLRPDCGIDGSGSCDLFTETAQKASRAAQEVQKAVVEVDVTKDTGGRAECSRALVHLAARDLDNIEAEMTASVLDGECSVREALSLARRRLEKVSGSLGQRGKVDAGHLGKGQARIEALVASGTFATALRTVDAARSEISRTRRVLALETEAKNMSSREASREDHISRQSQDVGLLKRPAVARAVQACRAAATAAERYESLGRRASLSLDRREELARDYILTALQAGEVAGIAEETLAAERDAAAEYDESWRRLEQRLKKLKSFLHRLQDRLGRLTAATKHRRASLEDAQMLAASWKIGSADGLGPCSSLPAEPDGAAAGQTTAEAFCDLEEISRLMKASWNVTFLEEEVELGLQRVMLAEAATAEDEIQGRRRDRAIAALKRAAEKTHSVVENARAGRVVGHPAVPESLSDAACLARKGLLVAVDSVEGCDSGHVEADEPLLDVAGRAEAAAEAAAEVVSRERLSVEQGERERQERCVELWFGSRRVEEMSTAGIVGNDPETAAMILEARSEVVQALVALEGADNLAQSLGDAQTALECAFSAEECFVKAQRKVRCFDAAANVLEQAEAPVLEAQTAMKAGSVPAADNRAAFQEALAKYEGVLNATVASGDGGADAFLEACNVAFAAAREVERAAMKSSRRMCARVERRRHELARLGRPTAALVDLDLSKMAQAPGMKTRALHRALAEAVRDALSAISSAREEVSEGRHEQKERLEAALAVRVDGAIQAASAADRAFITTRERERRAERWKREFARPEAALSGEKNEILTLPDAGLVLELCAASMRAADEALASAKEGVASTAGEVSLVDVEAMVQRAKAKAGAARREAKEQGARVKTSAQQRQMLRSALVSSADSLAQAQADLEADEEVRAAGNAAFASIGALGGNVISEALQRCTAAENDAVETRELLKRRLTQAWFRSEVKKESGSTTAGSDEEEQAVKVTQRAAAEAEGAAAHLIERLGQIRGIRAKLRSLLADAEARFRRASPVLADAGISDGDAGIDEAGQVASAVLTHARDRLRSPLISGYLVTGGGLLKDEAAVSEAQGYVGALEIFAKSAIEANANKREVCGGLWRKHVAGAPAAWTAPASIDGAENALIAAAGRGVLASAVKWGEALRTQVSDLRLGGDPTVSRSIEAVGNAMLAAEKPGSASNSDEEAGTNAARRAAVEGLAVELGKLEEVAENAAERRRIREEGLGAAARRLDRLMATLKSVEETVRGAGEPLVSLTSGALHAAWNATDATAAASAFATTSFLGKSMPVRDSEHRIPRYSPEGAAFIDAVHEAAVTVAQAEATANRARERASQVSAERVRALETLVALVETLSQVGDGAAAASPERGLSYSREAAAISEAQAAISRARTAAQVNMGSWVLGAAVIAEAVLKAGELLRVAERTADGPAGVHPMTPGRNASFTEFATNEAVAEAAKARAWLEAEAKKTGERVRGKIEQDQNPSSAHSGKGTTESMQRPRRIRFSSKGGGAPMYLPLRMRLQVEAWGAPGVVVDRMADGGGNRLEVDEENRPTTAAVSSASPPTIYREAARDSRWQGTRGTVDHATRGRGRRRKEEEERRLRAEVNRLKAEIARLRRASRNLIDGSGETAVDSGEGSKRSNFLKAA